MSIDLRPPQIYKKAHWFNTTCVFPKTQEICFGLIIDATTKDVRFKLDLESAKQLADSLRSYITAFEFCFYQSTTLNISTSRRTRPMTPTQIIGLIQYKTGMRIGAWAQANGVHKTNVYRAINNGRTKKPIHNTIADACRKTISEIWPEPAKEKRE